ncbi:hypothetical protein SERLADRAFT_432096 [Serpula lacrymans var. lacrymans S7.9]|nr:uncharacterized protein SERLADRAFT_432096 [Serpula lacrymans var. lacrymans S7.9]EGO30525.1 hypothetical protein SERLADRAFT_432096 [Serpula lacrymans var. lacrymans S7.9]
MQESEEASDIHMGVEGNIPDTNLEPDEQARPAQNAEPPQDPAPAPPAEPQVHQSTHIHQPAQYIRNLLRREGSVFGSNDRALLKGFQIPAVGSEADREVTEDNDLRELAANVAMTVVMADLEGVEPRTVEEAQKHPDRPKWEEAINEELNRL